MATPWIQASFTAGEISPSLFGHTDLQKMHVAATTARNMYVGYRGGLYSRAGTKFCARSKQPGNRPSPRLIKFQFSITQGYALEFGDFYMRIFSNGAPVVEGAFSVVAIAGFNPLVLTVPGHNYQTGDWVFVAQVGGTTQLNNNTYIVGNVSGGNFELLDLNGNPVDGSLFNPYTSGGITERVFTLATPYIGEDLQLLKFTESADVLSLTHPSYPPYDLARITATQWTLSQVSFAANIAAPGACDVVATTNPGSTTSPPTLPAAYAYCVTAVDALTGQESIASPIGNVTNSVDISVTAGSLDVTWLTVDGAGNYNIYRAPTSYNTQPGSTTDALPVPAGSPFGFVGTSFGAEFIDSNITPDFQQSPPLHRDPFSPGQITSIQMVNQGSGYTFANITANSATGSGFIGQAVIVSGILVSIIVQNGGSRYAPGDTLTIDGDGTDADASPTIGPQTGTYPGCVAYFQQRRVYANSRNNPDTYWMSQPGAFLNFDSSIPVTDADAVTGTPWAQQVNGVQAMVAMPSGLVVLTGLGAWQVTGSGGSGVNPSAITPSNQSAQPQAFNGCHQHVPPITINFDILYVQAKGSIVRDLNYNFFLNVYTGVDLTQLSGHLFTGFQIQDWAWCEEPYKVVWAVRNDGTLLSLTYLKEQEVYGWTRHDTSGYFFSVCSVTEVPVDALYLVAQRFPSDGAHYYIERMDNRFWNTVVDCWCVDSGLSLPQPISSPVTTVSGLQHLVGLTVTGLADGVVIPPVVVPPSGTITLPQPSTVVVVGLPFQAQFQSVYAEPGSQPTVQGRRKDITSATVRIEASAGLKAGTNQIDGSTTFPPSLAVSWTKMTPIKDQGATYTSPGGGKVTQLFTGDERVNLSASWRKPGQVALQQDNPLPMNILALIPEGLEGDTPEAGYAPSQQPQAAPQQQRGPGPWMLRR